MSVFNIVNLYITAMLTVWPDRAAPLAKKELLYTGPFGLAALLCGSVFIDRSNPDKARETLKTATKTIHDNQVRLSIIKAKILILNFIKFIIFI